MIITGKKGAVEITAMFNGKCRTKIYKCKSFSEAVIKWEKESLKAMISKK